MSKLNDLAHIPRQALQFYSTAPYPCSYVGGRVARSQVATPSHLIDSRVYGELLRMGFRRSGTFVHRPNCDGCNACTPLQGADGNLHTDTQSEAGLATAFARKYRARRAARISREHYELYLRYQRLRHHGGGMDRDSREQYQHFLLQSHVDTMLVEFRDADGALIMVSLIDILADGLSAVYTFYEPEIHGSLAPSASCGRSSRPNGSACSTSTLATGSRAATR